MNDITKLQKITVCKKGDYLFRRNEATHGLARAVFKAPTVVPEA
jgi:hypothetical protein